MRAATELFGTPAWIWTADVAEQVVELRAFSDPRLHEGYPIRRAAFAAFNEGLAKPITKDAFGASLRRWGIQGGPPADGSIDAAVLAALAAMEGEPGQPNRPAERLDMFRRDTPARLAAVRAAIERGDTAGVHRGARGFNGSCGALGRRHLQALCVTLESRGDGGTAAEAHGTLAAMEAELDRLRPWLRAELWHGSGRIAVEAI